LGLFRKEAVAHYTDPDLHGGLVEASTPSGWRGLLALTGAAAAIVAVAAFAEVPTVVSGAGRIVAEPGVLEIRSPAFGRLASLARAGDEVEAGQQVAVVADERRGPRSIQAPAAGVVDRTDRTPGEIVRRGERLARVVPGGARTAWMAVALEDRARLEPGDEVVVHVAGAGEAPVRARVRRVGASALDGRELRALVGEVDVDGPAAVVQLELPRGAGGRLAHGMPFTAEHEVGRRSVLSLVLPWLGPG